MEGRYFTLAEANSLLPRLEDLLVRLQELQREAQARYDEMEKIRAVGYKQDGNLIMLYDYRLAKRQMEGAVEEAKRSIQAIHEMGCQLKSIEQGLVDFPALIGGEEVLLCWQLGEPSVAFYHDRDGGFAARRPIDPSGA